MFKIRRFIIGSLLVWGVLSNQVVSKEIGFDPGLTKALAASLDPHGLYYKEYCPDSPNGRCYGTIPSGGGFYTLPIEADSEESIIKNLDVFINDGFKWKRDQSGQLVAEFTIDSRRYYTPATPNFYYGLQLNIPIGKYYAGITLNNPQYTPRSDTLDHASLEFRAVICPTAGEEYFMTLHYYNDGWSLKHNEGYSLAFNYAFSWNTKSTPFIFIPAFASQGDVMRQLGLPDSVSQPYNKTFFIDAHRFGMLPMPSNNSAITISCTANIENINFTKVSFNIKTFLEILEARGMIQSTKDYQYAGGIIAGVELWGRGKTIIQVKGHTMYDTPIESDGRISEGQFRLPDGSIWYSNGNAVCQYINLKHARVSSVYDITRIVNTIPKELPVQWCPGWDSIPLFDY